MRLINCLVLTMFLSQCASVTVKKNIPFTVKNAIYNSTTKELLVEFSSKKNIDFQELFYNHQKTKAVVTKNKVSSYISGTFQKVLLQDLNLHSNAKKEFGNKPTTTEKIPFELKENEAIITYKVNNEVKHYRIKKVSVI